MAYDQQLADAEAEINRLRTAFEAVLVGVNHIATYHTDRWPEPGTDHEAALETLGAGLQYDMWCCWNAAMRNRDALTTPPPTGSETERG